MRLTVRTHAPVKQREILLLEEELVKHLELGADDRVVIARVFPDEPEHSDLGRTLGVKITAVIDSKQVPSLLDHLTELHWVQFAQVAPQRQLLS